MAKLAQLVRHEQLMREYSHGRFRVRGNGNMQTEQRFKSLSLIKCGESFFFPHG